MVSGLEIRMNRIMNQGRMLCIPMDHGISNGPIPGLEDPHKAIAKCANHGLTSVIINKGVLKSMPKPTRIGILVHFSSSTSDATTPLARHQMRIFDVHIATASNVNVK